jgi:hypothetical protein
LFCDKQGGLISTNKKLSLTGGVAQVVEHLPSKHEAPSLNPTTTKKTKTKNPPELHTCYLRKQKWEDHGPGQPGHKSETLFERKLKRKKRAGK